ncbi:MAG TPA: cytochrome c peroxidase [Myxococcaceae bacterium]|nr:cytochrome c peroxidase [Myxococcaceae bacterium]
MNGYRLRTCVLTGILLGTLGAACTPEPIFPNEDELDVLRSLHTPLRRPQPDPSNRFADDARAASLGKKLFEDPKLSGCGTVSCASCHLGHLGGTVDTPVAAGCNGNYTGRNPPTVLNVAYSNWFMWDGRADRLWNQAILPLLSPKEMASDATLLSGRLTEGYLDEYHKLFGKLPAEEDPNVLLANFGKAIAAFERTLVRVDAPFDQDVIRFLQAVDAGTEEKDPAYLGLKVLVRKGQCTACHKGTMLADDLFHNVGVKDFSDSKRGVAEGGPAMLAWEFNSQGAYSDRRGGEEAARLDRLRNDLLSKAEELEGAYKTPTLRNIALTAPYMHTGELATLEDVVDLYDQGGEPHGEYAGHVSQTIRKLDLTDQEKRALVELLRSMTGAEP